ncbi:uncharacterized protein LOC143277597 [Babylonia areolata]|uniref:uncharacterized protein LOC143277597 n=1 Tax=Babylonia areolata TaxID=304850 RepID=UPI003FD552CA
MSRDGINGTVSPSVPTVALERSARGGDFYCECGHWLALELFIRLHCVSSKRERMGCTGVTLSLFVMLVAMVASEDDELFVPLPVMTSLTVRTSEASESATILVQYLAPELPFVLWYVNGLPIQGKRVDYFVVNKFSNKRGETTLSSYEDKESEFGVCLHNFEAEVCIFLGPLPSHTVREDLLFRWPLMTPGPLVRYDDGERVRIHAPDMSTPQQSVYYSALFFSKNPFHSRGALVQAASRGMDGGRFGDVVTVGPATSGTGWILEVRTDRANYEGVLMVNTTYVPSSGLVKAAFLNRPFSVYRHESDARAPFEYGFVAPIPNPVTWRCRPLMDCMVICPFVANGTVSVKISRMSISSVLDTERLPVNAEEKTGFTKMLGPNLGYGAIFVPNFLPEFDSGTYKCTYRVDGRSVVGLVEVN